MKKTVYIITNKNGDKALQNRNGELMFDKVSFITEIKFFYTKRIASDSVKYLLNNKDYKIVKCKLILLEQEENKY